jgi:hypothetical protein
MNDNQIRKRFLLTMKARGKWLDKYRQDVYLNQLDRKIMWVAATDVAKGAATRHYKRKQAHYHDSGKLVERLSPKAQEDQEVLHDRTLELIEFIKSAPAEREIAWIVSAFYLRFGEYDKRLQLEKRNRVGFSFDETPMYGAEQSLDDWDYGTKTTPQKPRSHRPKYVTHHANMERLVNDIYKKFGKSLSYDQVFEFVVTTRNYNVKQAWELASKIHRYMIATSMEQTDYLDE